MTHIYVKSNFGALWVKKRLKKFLRPAAVEVMGDFVFFELLKMYTK